MTLSLWSQSKTTVCPLLSSSGTQFCLVPFYSRRCNRELFRITSYPIALLKLYENFLLEFQQPFGEPTKQKMNPLVNTKVDKEDNVSQQDDTTFQLLPENLRCDESSQSDHFQEELADSIQDEASEPDLMDNFPKLVITQCIQLGKKCSHQPDLLPSFSNHTQPASKEDPIEPQGSETPRTPIRRARQKIQACLYCSHGGQFAMDCLAKSSQAPEKMNNPTHQ